MTLPFTDEYRDGEMVQCKRCAKNVRVKYYDRDTVVVVSTQEQQTLALRCQYCGYVLCDSCAHPADSLFPICPSCQREWGPYYFTHDAIMPSFSKPVPALVIPEVVEAQPVVQKPAFEPPPAPVETLGGGETELFGEYRVWERKKGFKRVLLFALTMLILGALVFLALGPGKPVIRKGLNLLSARPTRGPTNLVLINGTQTPAKAFTATATRSQTKATTTPGKPSVSSTSIVAGNSPQKSSASPTFTQTGTSTASPAPTETLAPTLTSPAPGESDCTLALAVTVDDVGKTLCVTGTVVFTMQTETTFSIYFSNDDGYFRIVIYDRIPTDIKKDVCIRVTGEIKILTGIPVIALGYHDVIDICTP
jgi:hypothetical protein